MQAIFKIEMIQKFFIVIITEISSGCVITTGKLKSCGQLEL